MTRNEYETRQPADSLARAITIAVDVAYDLHQRNEPIAAGAFRVVDALRKAFAEVQRQPVAVRNGEN